MSRNGNLIALVLGVGGGAVAWHLTRSAPTRPAAPPPAAAPTSGPPRADAPCSLKLDAGGLTADGANVDVAGAVARCLPQKRGDLVVAANAPAATLAQLTSAMQAAGIPLTQWVV
jgi:hypothetical protein